MADYIFHDPTGRRAKRAGLAGGLAVAFAALIIAAFFATLAFAPRLPAMQLRDPRILTALHVETAHRVKGSQPWTRVPRPHPHPLTGQPSPGLGRPLTVGFYVSWDPAAQESLERHVDQLDVVAPQWISLESPQGDVAITSDPRAEAIVANAKHPPSLLPVVHNAKNAVWNGPMADAVVLDPAARRKLIDQLVKLAKARGYAGYIFDLENLSPRAAQAYPAFLAQVKAAFGPLERDIWVTAPIDDVDWPLKKLQQAANVIVLMAYDEHYGTGEPGPPASQAWFQSHVASVMADLDPRKTVLALGSYGYDWALASKFNARSAAGAVTFNEATQTAHDSGAVVAMDEATLNTTYAYQDETGRDHAVWFLDAAATYNEIRVADPYRPMGYGLWRLGSEDPGVWKVLPHPYSGVSASGLDEMTPGQNVQFDGTGEVLKVTATPTPGHRTFRLDPGTGLIAGESYDVMPTSYVIQRYGAHPGWVAITFDDGPDSRWTPKILDILKAKQVQATFFVIGQNMQRFPELVQREIREGHVVGGHSWTHPNIAEVPAAQAQIELSATQRLFETLTGKSMRLFRPPFFGDAEPDTPREVAPLLLAQNQGYMTVGLRIDPDDWKKPDPKLIVERTLERLSDTVRPGQVVLLHDSGGDRSRTVEALPALIDALRAHGYKIVPVDVLAGMSRAQALPPTARNSIELMLDRVGFGFFHEIETVLRVLFLTAIALGVGRLLVLGVFALWHRLRIDARTPPLVFPEDGPWVSVLIPCFNEEKVIESSVRRILASRWANLEIIVLDDGSKDSTAQIVRDAFADEPRVTLMSFENGGKARALNRGLESARGEIVVALDADTLFPPDTIAKLARWFDDPRVGAVAGNAIVGNRVNLVTRWQALEYVTAQNLERRALAAVGAVTVVPGAVGAWRKAALAALGGYPPDTLAEDQDLTLAVQRAGWRVEFDPEARAYTEAPDTVAGLLKQRYRWSFGTLQCLWKHRNALFNPKRPVLGFIALPQIWLFQIILTAVAPLVDLAVIWSLITSVYGLINHFEQWSADDMMRPLFYWAAFIFLDLSAGALGMAMERQAPWGDLVWLPAQRFGYRQLMYYVVMKSIDSAVRGGRVGWGKLERRATASVGKAA